MASTTSVDLLSEVAAFMKSGALSGVIAAQPIASSHKATFTTADPGSEEILAEVCAMQPDDVDRAVRAAAEAFAKTDWAKLSPNDRGVLLHRLADEVERRKKINAHNVFPHGVPYSGVNKSGMGGGVLSIQTLFDYWRSMSVVRPL